VSVLALISDMLKPELGRVLRRLSSAEWRAISGDWREGTEQARKRIKDTEAMREHGFSD